LGAPKIQETVLEPLPDPAGVSKQFLKQFPRCPIWKLATLLKFPVSLRPKKPLAGKRQINPHIEHAFILTNLQAPTGNL
jgi:hypothetical protein